VVSPAGGRPRLLTRGEGDSLSVTRDGTVLYNDGHNLATIPLAGGKPRNLGYGAEGVWSPDGKRIAYGDQEGLMVENADGRHKRLVASTISGGFEAPPTWSPDGRKLAYLSCRSAFLRQLCENLGDGFDVDVVGIDGSDKHRVTPEPGFPDCPAWSSVGKLAFLAADSSTVAVVQKGGGLRTFRPEGCPVWAPSGRRFALETDSGAYLMNFDGSYRKQITVAPATENEETRIAWSPDGRWLAIVNGGFVFRHDSPTGYHYHLWIVRADGTELRRLL
jgi:Tol biopolymer transport system component